MLPASHTSVQPPLPPLILPSSRRRAPPISTLSVSKGWSSAWLKHTLSACRACKSIFMMGAALLLCFSCRRWIMLVGIRPRKCAKRPWYDWQHSVYRWICNCFNSSGLLAYGGPACDAMDPRWENLSDFPSSTATASSSVFNLMRPSALHDYLGMLDVASVYTFDSILHSSDSQGENYPSKCIPSQRSMTQPFLSETTAATAKLVNSGGVSVTTADSLQKFGHLLHRAICPTIGVLMVKDMQDLGLSDFICIILVIRLTINHSQNCNETDADLQQ